LGSPTLEIGISRRLGGATSPYLLQHASNPVDWWQWEDAAFAEAKQRDVPVMISIGYAARYWLHVDYPIRTRILDLSTAC
jgi:uncharacterized protein YyaL (SSP411 family)